MLVDNLQSDHPSSPIRGSDRPAVSPDFVCSIESIEKDGAALTPWFPYVNLGSDSRDTRIGLTGRHSAPMPKTLGRRDEDFHKRGSR
jgi:hypothetical protein